MSVVVSTLTHSWGPFNIIKHIVSASGWQTRWFVLENGIISYYKSQEEVSQGCKGSVKVSVCQINGKCINRVLFLLLMGLLKAFYQA